MMKKILKIGLAILGLSSAGNASMTPDEQKVLDYARAAYSNPATLPPEILKGFNISLDGNTMRASRESNGSSKVTIEDLPGDFPSVARFSSTSSANGVQQQGSTVFEIILHPQPAAVERATTAHAAATLIPGEDRGQTLLQLLSARSAAAPGTEAILASHAIGNFVLNGAPDELIGNDMARRLAFDAVFSKERRAIPIEKFSTILAGQGLSASLIDIFERHVESARTLLPQPVVEKATAAATPLPDEGREQKFLQLLHKRKFAFNRAESTQTSQEIGKYVLEGSPDELTNHDEAIYQACYAVIMDEQGIAKPIKHFANILSGPPYNLPQHLIDIFAKKVENARAVINRGIAVTTAKVYAVATPLPGEDRGQTLLRLLRVNGAAANGTERMLFLDAIKNFVLEGAPYALMNHQMARIQANYAISEGRAQPIKSIKESVLNSKPSLEPGLIDMFIRKVESARAAIEKARAAEEAIAPLLP